MGRIFQVGETLILKKPHPCGNNTFVVVRTGADIRIKCITCGREVTIPKVKLEKQLKP